MSSAELAERRRQVLALRTQGLTWAQIGAELGVSSRAAFTDGKRALEVVQADLKAMAQLHLALEMARLDTYRVEVQGVLDRAKAAGDGLQVLRATDRLIHIGKRHDELLGLTRVTVEATKATDSGGERPHAEDGVDEVARRRAARRIAARK